MCCLPLVVFMIQDSFVIGKTTQWSQQNEEYEIARNHPIISSLYSKYYSPGSYTSDIAEYNIKEALSQDKNQEKIKQFQAYFDEEINKLLEYKVIPYGLIELQDKEKFTTDFGYIRDFSKELNRSLYLQQYFRLHTDNDISTSYEYNMYAKKINKIGISNKQVNDLSDKQLQDICKKMISYLELDDIDDWEYSNSGYISQKAKLIVYCYVEHYESFDSLCIGIELKDNFIDNQFYYIETN